MSNLTKKLSLDECQVCGSRVCVDLLAKKRERFESKWVKCLSCDSAHIDPYPSLEELNQYYNSNYTEMNFTNTSDQAVNHNLRFSEDYAETVFAEYQLTLEQLNYNLANLREGGD